MAAAGRRRRSVRRRRGPNKRPPGRRPRRRSALPAAHRRDPRPAPNRGTRWRTTGPHRVPNRVTTAAIAPMAARFTPRTGAVSAHRFLADWSEGCSALRCRLRFNHGKEHGNEHQETNRGSCSGRNRRRGNGGSWPQGGG